MYLLIYNFYLLCNIKNINIIIILYLNSKINKIYYNHFFINNYIFISYLHIYIALYN